GRGGSGRALAMQARWQHRAEASGLRIEVPATLLGTAGRTASSVTVDVDPPPAAVGEEEPRGAGEDELSVLRLDVEDPRWRPLALIGDGPSGPGGAGGGGAAGHSRRPPSRGAVIRGCPPWRERGDAGSASASAREPSAGRGRGGRRARAPRGASSLALAPDGAMDPEETQLTQLVALLRLSGEGPEAAKYQARLDAFRAQREARPMSVDEAAKAKDAAAESLQAALQKGDWQAGYPFRTTNDQDPERRRALELQWALDHEEWVRQLAEPFIVLTMTLQWLAPTPLLLPRTINDIGRLMVRQQLVVVNPPWPPKPALQPTLSAHSLHAVLGRQGQGILERLAGPSSVTAADPGLRRHPTRGRWSRPARGLPETHSCPGASEAPGGCRSLTPAQGAHWTAMGVARDPEMLERQTPCMHGSTERVLDVPYDTGDLPTAVPVSDFHQKQTCAMGFKSAP
ncbi:unnamed protein product, partial [Prorocentrum cordatum]